MRCAWKKFQELSGVLTRRGSVVEVEGKGVCHMCEKCYDLWERDMGNECRAATKAGKGGNANGSVDVRSIVERGRQMLNCGR